MLCLALVAWVFHVQVIRHLAETHPGAGGAQIRQGFLHTSADHALQSDMAVVYDNVDGRCGLETVSRQYRVTVDRARHLLPEPVIHGRQRQNFDLVRQAGHARHVLSDTPKVRLLVRLSYFAEQINSPFVYGKVNAIKNAVTRIHANLVCELLGDVRVRRAGDIVSSGACNSQTEHGSLDRDFLYSLALSY